MVDVAELYDVEQEPVGIVISRGNRAEATPAVWEYIWGPVPDAPTVGASESDQAA
jgi:hypothetical protein